MALNVEVMPSAQSIVQRVREYNAVYDPSYERNLSRAEPGDEIVVEFYPSGSRPHGYPDLRIRVTSSADTNTYLQGLATGGPENWQDQVQVLIPGSTIIQGGSAYLPDTLAPSLYPEIRCYDSDLYKKRLYELNKNRKVRTYNGYELHWDDALHISEEALEAMLAWKTLSFPEVAEVSLHPAKSGVASL